MKIQLAVSFLYLQVVTLVAWTEHIRRPESWLSSVTGGRLIQATEDQWDMLSVFTSEWENLDRMNQPLFSSWSFCNLQDWTLLPHKHGLQWQDSDSRGGGSSWTWIVFFQGVSILSKNSDEAKNSPTPCTGPSKQSQLPLKAMCTQASTCFLLFHNLFLCPGCDALVVWLQQCWCWEKKKIV